MMIARSHLSDSCSRDDDDDEDGETHGLSKWKTAKKKGEKVVRRHIHSSV